MNNPWQEVEFEGEIIRLKSTACIIPKLALIWRGIPEKETDKILEEASAKEEDVYSHPEMPWLEPICRLILKAVSDKKIASSYYSCNDYYELQSIGLDYEELPPPELNIVLYDFLEFLVEYHTDTIDKIPAYLQAPIEFIKAQKDLAPKRLFENYL